MATLSPEQVQALKKQKREFDRNYKALVGPQDQGQKHRDAAAARSRQNSAAVSDIGELPAVVDPDRKEACRFDLFLFLTTYFPSSTGLSPFSDDHRRVIERIQRCVLEGGKYVNAVYRGFGKTTISENAAIWAILYGHRRFVLVIGAAQENAKEAIGSIQSELEDNDLLFEDFPEVCFPIRALEGKNQRCASQTYNGKLTGIEFTAEALVLPTIPGSAASGAIVRTKGIESASRGVKFKTKSGTQQRPDFIIGDDPQTDESATRSGQVTTRLNLIRKWPRMSGHRDKVAVVINATVIAPDDAIDQLLSKPIHAAWQGERIAMVRKFADAHDLWLGKYREIRCTYDRDLPGDQERAHVASNDFYTANRPAMDAGCEVSWDHCFDAEHELSAIQHAYNILVDEGEDIFASECQNKPQPIDKSAPGSLTAEQIRNKTNGIARRTVPLGCDVLTCFIDVQGSKLYWTVCAWGGGFSGAVIDYGSWPDEGAEYFTLAGSKQTLQRRYPTMGLEARIHQGLTDLTAFLLNREWSRELDGATMRIRRCLIDSGWGDSTDVVYDFCRRSPHAALLMPSKGVGVQASSTPFAEYKKHQGDKVGHYWRIPSVKGKRIATHVLFDSNYFKSFIFARLAVAMADPGCLSLFEGRHEMLADHLVSEYGEAVTAKGRTVIEYKSRPQRSDNHLLDCLVGCAVAASMEGICLPVGTGRPRVQQRRRTGPKKATYL